MRLNAFLDALSQMNCLERLDFRSAGPASDAEICLFHDPLYLAEVRRKCAIGSGVLDEGPTLARQQIETAATYVVGAVMDALRRIMTDEFSKAFIPIAGFHHAFPKAARLYCLYNDPAIAVTLLLKQLDGQIMYIDIDVHQGDGVYQAFESEPRVGIVDLHEDPSTLFPNSPDKPGLVDCGYRALETGLGHATGTNLNIPLAPYTDELRMLEHWELAERFIREAEPQFIIFESGVDCLDGDPLSNQKVTSKAIKEIAWRVARLADEFVDGRLLILGGGGYNLDNLARGWTAVVEGVLDL
ncbi:MAG: acetoin utilization protein AcuC [Myxococcota bacterium]|nr:acetoin utilization protein AcuC [Myxococcota bacterium]